VILVHGGDHVRRGGDARRTVDSLVGRSERSRRALQLPDALGLDVITVQGWESGRRPLPAVSSGEMARFRTTGSSA
jgi:hypothetical protein